MTGKFRNTINIYPIAEKHIERHAKWNQKDYALMTGIMIGIDTSQPAAGHGLLRMLGILLSDQISAEKQKSHPDPGIRDQDERTVKQGDDPYVQFK